MINKQAQVLKIGIVEDDLIIALAISEMLTDCGYTVTEPATHYGGAIAMIEEEHPDLLLLDIHIPGRLDGITVAQTVKEQFGIPFIFLTGNSDAVTVGRAKPLKPAAFLSKPVTRHQLFAAIEIAVSSFPGNPGIAHTSEYPAAASEFLFLKDNACYNRIHINEIINIESDENYVRLYLEGDRKMLIRSTLTEFIAQLYFKMFIRVHRCHAVAVGKIKQVQADHLLMDNNMIVPVSRVYKDELMRLLRLK